MRLNCTLNSYYSFSIRHTWTLFLQFKFFQELAIFIIGHKNEKRGLHSWTHSICEHFISHSNGVRQIISAFSFMLKCKGQRMSAFISCHSPSLSHRHSGPQLALCYLLVEHSTPVDIEESHVLSMECFNGQWIANKEIMKIGWFTIEVFLTMYGTQSTHKGHLSIYKLLYYRQV